MKRILFASLAALLFSSAASWAEGRVSLASKDGLARWQLSPADTSVSPSRLYASGFQAEGWIPAVVPGATFTSYVEAGLEPDPNFGDNAYKVDKEKYRRDYWYRTEIPTDSFTDGKHVWLCFEGINRKGDVWFNGSLLGTLDGFMDRGKFDVAPLLRHDGSANVIAVLVHSPKDPVPNYASPTYISSAGWDWMPYVPGLLGGITDNVYAEASGDITFEDPWVRTQVPAVDKGLVSLTTGLVNHSDTEKEVLVKGLVQPGGIEFERTVKVQAGRRASCSFSPEDFPQLEIANPALWWPNGYGEQNLYTCTLTCSVDGRESESRDITFGIREYSYDFVKGVFQLSVNGEKIYCKGGN